jgi:hypothetical protein
VLRDPLLITEPTPDSPEPRFTAFVPQRTVPTPRPTSFVRQGYRLSGRVAKREWPDRAMEYETRLAQELREDREALDEARHAVEVATGTPSPSGADLPTLMDRFFRAALPGERLKGYDREQLSPGELAGYLARGIRRTRATNDLPMELFEKYAALVDPDRSRLLAFRKAMLGWLIPRYSLHEVLEASVLARVGYVDVVDALAVKGLGTHLRLWADSALARARRHPPETERPS